MSKKNQKQKQSPKQKQKPKSKKIGSEVTFTLLPSTNIAVKPSEGRGRGVFAVKDIKAGDVIEAAPTIDIPSKEIAFVNASRLAHYMFEGVFSGEGVIALGYASLYNHDKKSNASWEMNDGLIVISADKNIKAGQEIFLDYGWGKEMLKKLGIK